MKYLSLIRMHQSIRISQLTVILAMGIAMMIASVGMVRTVLLPESQFMSYVVIDDAFYYLIPAQNLIAGRGYSFDGIHRTNGVQPLWALISIFIAWISPDRLAAVRLLALSSGTAWILAGVLLFFSLRMIHKYIAVLASIGWLLSGFWSRTAFMGMENGISALTLALVIYLGVRFYSSSIDQDRSAHLRFLFLLGFACTLFGLARVEHVLLGGLFGVACFFKKFNPHGKRGTFTFVLPFVIGFGALITINWLYFGNILPISGSVKLFYEHGWISDRGFPTGSVWGNLWQQIKHLFEMTFTVIVGPIESWVKSRLSLPVTINRLNTIPLAILGYGILLAFYRFRLHEKRDRAVVIFWTVLTLFGIGHFSSIIMLLPHFTSYGIWYFASEILLLWIAFSASWMNLDISRLWKARVHFFQYLMFILPVAFLLLVNSQSMNGASTPPLYQDRVIVQAGKWLEEHLSAGQRIGTLSSGFVSYYSPSHQIYNLDGLMNDEDYFQNYMQKNRLYDYITREEIGYLADYRPSADWIHGFQWLGSVPLEQMELIRWWPFDRTLAYAIWRILPPGSSREILTPCKGFCDRLSQIQFAASVQKTYPIVPDEKLVKYIDKHPKARVVTSFSHGDFDPLQHVIMLPEEYRAINLRPTDLDIENKLKLTFNDSIQLIGFDSPRWDAYRGYPFQFTRYWQSLVPILENSQWVIYTQIGTDGPNKIEHIDQGCHNTCPLDQWEPGDIVVETYSIIIPPSQEPGVYPIFVAIRNDKNVSMPLNPNENHGDMVSNLVFVGNLHIH